MRAVDIETLSRLKDKKSRLEHKQKTLAISVSLAAGLAWKEKVLSFYDVIAKELLEIFDQHLLDGEELNAFNKNYVRIYLDDKTIYFNQNNLFLNTYEKKSVEDWLSQDLLIVQNKQLPSYLTTSEKEKLFKKLTLEEIHVINNNYNRQELNSDKFPLNLNKKEEEKLIEILTKAKYYSLSIKDYIKDIATGNYQYGTESTDSKIIYFKNTYDRYILELGAYISKVIEEYLEKNH